MAEPHKHTTAEKLYYLKEKMACMIGNMTCMLRDLDWMKEDKTPNYALYEKDINNIPAASEGLKHVRISQQNEEPLHEGAGYLYLFLQVHEYEGDYGLHEDRFKEYAAKDGY